MFIKFLDQITKEDTSLMGGKGASLGEMTRALIPVPPGFVITTRAFASFYNQEIPVEIRGELYRAFDSLEMERVAVRSSATLEDSSSFSWAGQLETFLNVTRGSLLEKIRDCWNSIHSERALSYASQNNISEEKLKVAVVVQRMVDSESSGVIFTVNPVTGNREEVMVEACFGLGEFLVQGLISPDNFLVDKKNLEIKNKEIMTQERMLIFDQGKNKEIQILEEKGSSQAISDDQVKVLAQLSIKIEEYYHYPQDIEWAIDKNQKIWILQSRPITTI